jgi:Zn-dependent protease with chaperone function
MYDFFERQDAARRLSARMAAILAAAVFGAVVTTAFAVAGLATLLALVQVVATTRIEVNPAYWLDVFTHRFYMATFVTGAIVIGVAVQRTLRTLESGGIEVARQLGGTRVLTIGDNPQYQQLINVVEEMSIAAGTTAPKIFVLEDDDSINAFAAGVEPADTVVGVTRGALEHLNRSELQGVLAHEFSHIVNRDVRINVQTLGALQGIEAIASAANYLLRMGVSSGVNGSMLATAFGGVLWPVGQIGVLFGSLARMALNRQREFLADAAAVQFTRYPEGLSSALKLIATHERQGRMTSEAARAASHFFFAEGTPSLGRLLSSHPPIELRIRRLDPEWDGVLPIALPAHAVEILDRPESDRCCDEVETATRHAPMTDCGESGTVAPLPTATAPIPPDAPEADETRSAEQGGIFEADKQAFLETLTRVRTSSTRREYDPSVTHWPTLVAAAAAVLGGLILFSLLT